uniref:Integrase, catalytic region, zinc finger, CCHC-type, peptidase aspartic, catalytic n=1 Tax=Tanacetum cinerariifolium TaxID=118510 RepID=A0A699IH08_TANCI|nr:hypothetical protein [Tanacetum cinerariifolium]
MLFSIHSDEWKSFQSQHQTALRPGQYRKDFPKLRNQNRKNKTRNKTGNNKATARAYAIGGRGANPDSNVVTVILSGADNHPPMLGKDMYDSWKSRMELYIMNRQHGQMILESVEHGLLIWPTIEKNGVTRPRKYSELTPTEAIQADYDVKATNIILQGLPPEVYALVSNHRIAKEL